MTNQSASQLHCCAFPGCGQQMGGTGYTLLTAVLVLFCVTGRILLTVLMERATHLG